MGGSGRPQAPGERGVGGADRLTWGAPGAPQAPGERAASAAAVALEWPSLVPD
jgi:hypothetical protein